RRDQEVQVLRQEEARQGRDHIRQHEDADEREEHDPEDLAGEQRPEVFHAAEVLEDPVEDGEHADPEGEPHEGQDEQLGRAPAGALFADPLQGGAPLGLEHPPERGLRHAARPPSLFPPPSTSTKSRTCAPPVSFKNSSSRLASPARRYWRRWATLPAATSCSTASPS